MILRRNDYLVLVCPIGSPAKAELADRVMEGVALWEVSQGAQRSDVEYSIVTSLRPLLKAALRDDVTPFFITPDSKE